MLSISVIGLGAWGSALGMTAFRAGNQVTMIGLPEDIARLNSPKGLPFWEGMSFPKEICATSSYEGLRAADIIVLAVPAQSLKACLAGIRDHVELTTPFVIASKGIEQGTNLFVGEILEEVLDNPYAILSGPNFAAEILQNLPACTVIASTSEAVSLMAQDAFHHIHFRPYISSDVMGVQIVGAVKNVLAIGSGIIKARGLGENALAAFVTRGLSEIKTLGIHKGGRLETFIGLAGMGDVMLTCMSAQSRNFQLGLTLGKESRVDLKHVSQQTVEGFHTVKALKDLAEKEGIEMALSETIYAILYEGVAVDTAIEALLNRPLK